MSASAIPTDVPRSVAETRILFVRGQKVLLDSDLAELSGVETKVLNQAVKRNSQRFPRDFVFQLTRGEADQVEASSSKTVPINGSNRGKKARDMPLAFTEQGVAMVSSVLSSDRAIEVNIEIMRTFVRNAQSCN
jgi:ORF6N domain